MLSLKRSVLLMVAAAGWAAGPVGAQPALTTIQDILYRANGTRFSGTMFIQWSSFLAGDTSNIATSSLTVPIVNGVLQVSLVPTTTASAGAQYNITYNSGGQTQFTEIWAVPPSTFTLRVSDVRVSTGTVVGPPPVMPGGDTSSFPIGDVIGLANALGVRPQEGTGFVIGRTAIINQAGQIDGSAGALGNCVHVDGSSGPCGSSGLGPLYSDAELPGGAINGSNAVFTLAFSPSPPASLVLFLNGLILTSGTDYALAGNTITFYLASVPQTGDVLLASYRYGNPSNPLSSLAATEVVCSSAGNSTSATTATQLGSCTIPAGLLETGDRIEVQFHFGHTGTTTAFTGQLNWGSATILSRTSVAAETALAGHLSFGILASGQSWDAQSWGNSFAVANVVGTAAANTTQNLTISFLGGMAGTTTDAVTLLNFTVIRYPAQANP
jgi:hypothetical protein